MIFPQIIARPPHAILALLQMRIGDANAAIIPLELRAKRDIRPAIKAPKITRQRLVGSGTTAAVDQSVPESERTDKFLMACPPPSYRASIPIQRTEVSVTLADAASTNPNPSTFVPATALKSK